MRLKETRLFRRLFHGRRLMAEAVAELRALRQDLAGLRGAVAALEARVAAFGPPRGEAAGEAYFTALRGVGVLNYHNPMASGENHFLRRFAAQAPGALVLDVGANTGQFVELLRDCGGAGAVHCFEPHPASFATLAARAAALRCTAHALALGASEGEMAFYDYADEAGSQHASVYREVIEGLHQRPAASTRVRCTTLDAMAAALGLGRIGLLKIDTEGHELAVLQGARGLLAAGAIDVILFEFNEMNVISRVFMRDFFRLLPGYRLCRLLPDGALEFQAYDPRFMEVFAYQNIACIRRDLDPHWLLGN